MKIRRMVSILTCCACLVAGAGASLAQDELDEELPAPAVAVPQPTLETGRYQLFDGQYSVTSVKGPEVAERHLFRLDTVTGAVWVGKQVQYVDKRSGKVIQQRYWEPFEQYLEAPQAATPGGR